MNLYITENIDKVIEHYITIPIIYGKIDLGRIPDNSAKSIIAVDALDSVPLNLIGDFIQSIIQKMRLGGSLVIGGTDISLISKDYLNGKISTKSYNELIYAKRGIYCLNEISEIFKNNNLLIENVTIKGYQYEISVTRQNN